MSTDNDIVPRMRLWAEGLQNQKDVVLAVAITEAADEIERLRSERDEARQRVCSIAYPEQHIQELVKTINTLRIERDEARRYACDNNPFRLTKWQLAKIKGWDCFDLENCNA